MSTVREELESAWNPDDVVLAVIPEPEKSLAAYRALREAGFAEKDIALFRVQEAAERLDIEGKRSTNPILRPLRAFWSYFSIEGPELRAYEEAQ